MRNKLIKFIEKELNISNLDKLLQKSKNPIQGDFSLLCFTLGKNPVDTSKQFQIKLENKSNLISKVEAVGPFLNFFLNKELEAKETLDNVSKDKLNFKLKKEKILIEFPSPNTNKELHIGHTRNMLLGNSLSNLLEKVGNIVIRTNMNNDRGIAICKTMLAYQLFGNNQEPNDLNMNSDEFVSHWYVLYGEKNKSNPELNLDEKAQQMLVQWESQDKEVIKLWKKLMGWVFQGYGETYKNYKLKSFDKEYFESEIYTEGKDIVLNALKKGINGFKQEDDGAICYDFNDKTYGKKYLLRGDGTTLYMTQDLYLASLKNSQFKPNKSIFVVAVEQKYHFEVLFQLLEKLGFGEVKSNYHLAYGYVYDKNGNKFSSREGNVLGANWLLSEIISKSKENLKSKELTKNLSEKELDKRATVIGFGALAFSFLKVNPNDDMKFDLDKALKFEGDTGPYVMYTYARIKSILRKAKKYNDKIDYSKFSDKENKLITTLSEYENIVKESATKYKVSMIPNYLIKLSQEFNEYYQNVKILEGENDYKLFLIENISKVLKDGLDILNINVLEEM